MRRFAHRTATAQHNAALAEDLTDFREGDRVMTVDGFPGRVTGVLFGPYQGTENYQVTLDGGMGGGDYNPGQLKPIATSTAAKVEAAEITASIPIEAVTEHMANADYPELENILQERQPVERISVYAANQGQMGSPDMVKDDPGENMDQEQNGDGAQTSNEDTKPEDEDQELGEDGEDPNAENSEAVDAKLGDVTMPSACSYCGGSSFGDTQMTGRGVRVRCDQCGGTMSSWGGQWQPEFPNSSQNKASEQGDYRSGGAAGIANAPGAKSVSTSPDDNVQEEGKDEKDDGKTIKLKIESVVKDMSNPHIAESLQSEAGIVQYLFNRMYDKARKHYEDQQNEWWMPPVQDVGPNLEGPANYTTVTPGRVTVGSLSEYDDPNWKWHFTSSWIDVQAKARRIRKENHVKIVASSRTFVTAEVLGDQATYETQLNYVPGTRKVADWACGCKWASYAWGRSKRYQRFEGRLCSHALATQYEASSRGIFGRDVEPDRVRPDWQNASSPIVVQYDKANRSNLDRPATIPNVRRSFSALVLDSDGVYPEPARLDLQHPPVYASVQTMIDNEAGLVDVIEMLASVGVAQSDARDMVVEALLSAEASKQHKHHKPTNQEHGRTWGYGLGFGWGPCGMCGGSGCNNCNGTGQVPPTDDNGAGEGGAVDAGGDAGGDMSATSAMKADKSCACCSGSGEHSCGHECYACDASGKTHEDDGGELCAMSDHLDDDPDRGFEDDIRPDRRNDLGRSAMLVLGDYSTADPMSGLDAGQMFHPNTLHSHSDNPSSTGWATSQDPGDWGKSLISNNFGVQTDASHHYAEDMSMTEAAADHIARMYDATLNEEPEAALPYTTGDGEDVDGGTMAGNTAETGGDDAFENTSGNIGNVSQFNSLGALTEEQQIVADFQKTAGAKKLAMKDFSFDEQQELINEGKGGGRARNFNDLKISNTHYALIPDDADDDESILWV